MNRRALILLLVPALACTLLASFTLALRPRTFTSHSMAIGYVLEQRGVAYESVRLALPWPESVNYFAYGAEVYPYNANVVVELPGGGTALGKMECRDDQRNCRVTIARLGVERQSVPNLHTPVQLAWMTWAEEQWRTWTGG
jgi:hypothetical protein